MIHFCIKHQWRDIYRPGMLKVKYHQMFISEVIQTSYPALFDHLLKECDEDIEQVFTQLFASQLVSVFISDLQSHSPKIATHILDAFLIDGEMVI